jgi:hypothetical protein
VIFTGYCTSILIYWFLKINPEEQLILFMEKFEAGTIGDESEFFDWFAAKRGLDFWNKRLKIISAIDI